MSLFLSRFHKGNIFENLADFLLGSLGISNPPRRQFDQGYDFYCYLSQPVESDDSLLYFDFPYTIQLKSGKEDAVTYGNSDYHKWRREDIQWVFNHETPFFIGFLDTDTHELKIYDTTGIWYLYVNDQVNCSQITFTAGEVPLDYLNSTHLGTRANILEKPMRSLPVKTELKSWGPSRGDGYKHTIDMGNPIVTISVEDTKDPVTIAAIKRVLRLAITIEQKNIANRKLGINFFKEIKNNRPNDISFLFGSTYNVHPTVYLEKLKEQLKEGLISLLINAANVKDLKLVAAVRAVLSNLPKDAFDKQLEEQNPSLFFGEL
jgi:hypothetical protein